MWAPSAMVAMAGPAPASETCWMLVPAAGAMLVTEPGAAGLLADGASVLVRTVESRWSPAESSLDPERDCNGRTK